MRLSSNSIVEQYCIDYTNMDANQQSRNKKKKKICAILAFLIIHHYYENVSQRKIWVKPWVARRREKGCHFNLFLEVQLEDPDKFRRCLRMSVETSKILLSK